MKDKGKLPGTWVAFPPTDKPRQPLWERIVAILGLGFVVVLILLGLILPWITY